MIGDGVPARRGRLPVAATLLVVAVFVVVLGAGCGRDEAIRGIGDAKGTGLSEPQRCDEAPGPPTTELVVCRLLHASAAGQFERQITPEQAALLVAEWIELAHVRKAVLRNEASQDDFHSGQVELESLCMQFTGRSCADVFLSRQATE
jgi:hypothetical protein